ncbi:hypothetical protein E3T54_11920 [Cryobacterium sp. Sr8]|uniref:hypothetical protein n=1 Tax=Cryobacterium sp. Sr8 TaxID=1259203 RepID=UPI001068FF42|nr:hypothetical protein [Cryobacterium sp. Sr8]TFD75433.1 hypothetical protein E3T54_11920 [Cryobacterium sp. Sr8]
MDDVAFYESLGPWATQRAVRDTLGVDDAALDSMRESHRLLAVRFGGDLYYPLPQFTGGRVIAGLEPVLIALSAGFTSPEAQAAWFAEPAYEDDARTRWQVLGDGDGSDVVRWAGIDAAAVRR